jgi:hypothetical protein
MHPSKLIKFKNKENIILKIEVDCNSYFSVVEKFEIRRI